MGVASVARLKCYIKAIQKAGIDCEMDVFERRPSQVRDIFSKEIRKNQEGISYWYAGGRLYGSSNIIVRQYNGWKDRARMIRHLRENIKEGDVVLVYFSDVSFTKQVIKTVHQKGGFIVKELNELPGKGKQTPRAERLKSETEKKVMPLFDGIICISENLLAYAQRYAHEKCVLTKIPILVDFNEYNLEDRQNEAEIKYIFHAGSLYEQKDGILGMIEAFGNARKRLPIPINYVITGNPNNSPHKEEIEKLIKDKEIEDAVIFTGYLTNEELRNYLSKSSCVIINKYKTLQNDYCFSTKLGEYMAAGKPIVITKVGEATNWLKDGETVFFVEPHKIEELSDAIVRVFSNNEESKALGRRGKMFCKKNFNCWEYSDKIVGFLNNIVNG